MNRFLLEYTGEYSVFIVLNGDKSQFEKIELGTMILGWEPKIEEKKLSSKLRILLLNRRRYLLAVWILLCWAVVWIALV